MFHRTYFLFIISSANVDRFSNFFTGTLDRFQRESVSGKTDIIVVDVVCDSPLLDAYTNDAPRQIALLASTYDRPVSVAYLPRCREFGGGGGGVYITDHSISANCL